MELMIVVLEAAFFFVMGVVALVAPAFVVGLFGETNIGPDMRNEVRAVYGGFGVAIAAVLLASLKVEAIRSGVYLVVATALFGMACGRIVSFLLEQRLGLFPAVFLVVELLLGSALLYAT